MTGDPLLRESELSRTCNRRTELLRTHVLLSVKYANQA